MAAIKTKKVAAKKSASTAVKGNISVPQAQKLLKAKAKTLASVPGRSKVLVVTPAGGLAVVKKGKG